MIAMSVILVSMTVLYQALLSGQILSADNKLRHRALQDASSLMEQMSVVPLPNLSATFAHDAPIAEFAGLHCPNQSVRVVYEDAAATTEPPVNYRVISTWTSTVGRPETLVLRGVRAR
ncbi:MAG TPA: hypothetical protein VEI02_02820 [Planctomycetota bacterium]|nr:hypothetical protein [Planctomycetota bacterium]